MVKSFKHSLRAGLAATAFLSSVAVAASADAAIIYNVNQTVGFGSVVGSITTDGATGVLSAGNFLDWDLTLNGVGASYHLTRPPSVVELVGSGVSATPTKLLFDFGAAGDNHLLFQDGLYSGTQYWCAASSAATCLQGQTVAPQFYSAPSGQNVQFSGQQVIGVAAVPEPAVWAMLLMGVAALGAMLRRRRAGVAATA
jgi:hypothetical protein